MFSRHIIGVLLSSSIVLSVDFSIETTFKPKFCDVEAKDGDALKVHYTGSIHEESATGYRGKVFDSSLSKKRPLRLILGRGEVIKGWEDGLAGICVGEKRTLTIPPELGYGQQGSGRHIPGDATLKFDVECVDIVTKEGSQATAKKPLPNVFKEIDIDNDWLITYDEMMMYFIQKGMKLEKYRWHLEDKNRDGIVTWEEFSGLKGEEGPPGTAKKAEL